jgi:hypothetical protein
MAIEFSPLAATNFPTGGHVFSLLVATNFPTNRLTGLLCLGEWLDPLAGGGLGEPVAVLPVGAGQLGNTGPTRHGLHGQSSAPEALTTDSVRGGCPAWRRS